MRMLVKRIDEWEEDDDAGNSFDPMTLREAYRASEELILDIKQCLESVLEEEDLDD